MRRFLTLVCLLCLAIPAGISISGCTRNPDANYCNGLGYGLKVTDVYTINLQPQTFGISLAFGQTLQANAPSAKTCNNQAASVKAYTYGTSNNQLLDISPNGYMCAGTWNRNTGGGIANYTYCTPPNPLPSTDGLPYGIAYITASASSVTSNPVEVFVHPQVTSVTLEGPKECLSQGQLATLDSQACFLGSNNKQLVLCAPPSITNSLNPAWACPGGPPSGVAATQVPDCSAVIGNLNYNVATGAVGALNIETNQITAQQPGTTVITANVAGGSASAGYFSTCPPQSINVTLANGKTAGTVTQGVTQSLTTSVIDTQGNPITGLTLDYQSTDPIDITAVSGGSITTNFPGVASVYAICQPTTCNPAPINQVGVYGTGLSISSNPVTITVPGTASDYVWFSAPGQSQYVIPVELLTGSVGSTVRLPYVPNSVQVDRLGTNLYLGSSHELMVYNTSSNSVTKQDPSAPGVVLAVSPNDTFLLINDQVRQVFYFYSASNGITGVFGGLGSAAAWTPDSKTLYITDSAALNDTPKNIAAGTTGHTDTLYVYNVNTGWTSSLLACSSSDPAEQKKPYCDPSLGTTPSNGAQNLAITIPSVGAFLSGNPTVAHTWCPSGLVGDYANILFYPQGPSPENSVAATTEVLAATTNGNHILGAATSGGDITLSDIGLTIPQLNCLPPPSANNPLDLGEPFSPLVLTTTLSQATITADAAAVNQVVPAPASNLAFVTYAPPAAGATTGASLPYYVPGSGGAAGTVKYVTLMNGSSASTTVTAPIAGAFSPDSSYFFVSTAGDSEIHYIAISPNAAPADVQQISPNLPACVPGADPNCVLTNSTVPASGIVPATAIAVKPRSTT